MDKRVIVLLPSNRRQIVNVTSNTTLLEILEIACKKNNLDSEVHCLKFHNKEVCLTQMFQFSGLPNNCILEMQPTEKRRVLSNVIVCVQLPDGTRAQGEFSPGTCVWDILRQLCSEVQNYKSPVVIYMRSEVIGREKLERTTLKSLGILEGRAMLRLLNKSPEELKTQANVYKMPDTQEKAKVDETPQTSRAARASDSNRGGSGGFAITSDIVKSLKRNASDLSNEETNESDNESPRNLTNVDEEKPKYDWGTGTGYSMHKPDAVVAMDNDDEFDDSTIMPPTVNIIGPRQALLFSLAESRKVSQDLPDSFFDLTVSDLKMILRDLKRTSSGDDDAPLLTSKLRELERQKLMLNKLNQYKDCVLRIQFPDRYVLQGIFKPYEPFGNVEEFVKGFLENQNQSFHLFTIPPKVILPSDKTLLELDFVPNAVVHFTYEQESTNNNVTYVSKRFIDQISTEEAAHYAVQKYRLTRASTSS